MVQRRLALLDASNVFHLLSGLQCGKLFPSLRVVFPQKVVLVCRISSLMTNVRFSLVRDTTVYTNKDVQGNANI